MIDADLKEFEDYLSEFNSVPQFDAETCRICGVSLSDSISVNRVPLIELQFENASIAEQAINMLEAKGIKSKQSSAAKEKILIPEGRLEDAKSILKS
jgi:CRISPR/Cas system-associated protein Csx1